jgi:hypothetical protein
MHTRAAAPAMPASSGARKCCSDMSDKPRRSAPTKPRLSLMQRQQQLLEERGFSAPRAQRPHHDGTSSRRYGRATGGRGPDGEFYARQEAHLAKQGRSNATSSSRQRAAMPDSLEGAHEGLLDDAASSTTTASRAPSLHPSLAGTAISQACSEVTIGAGDDTEYWDFQHRAVTAKDLGHTCRECRLPFITIGEPLTERRGARISTRYHAQCFSGYADPRSQVGSSHHTGRLAGSQMQAAPARKATSKMRTGSHFEHGGAVRGNTASMGGKHGAMMAMGSHGFGAASSKGAGSVVAESGPGGFTAAELQQHTMREQERLRAIDDDGHSRGNADMAREERMERFLAEQPLISTDIDSNDANQALCSQPEPELDE